MKISARNILDGTFVQVTRGATTAHVVVELSPVEAVIKSSDVIIAID